MNPSETNQCTLLFQTTDYNSSQTNLDISSDVTTLLRYDMHLARIDKQLCSEVHALPNLATSGLASQSSDYIDSGVPAAALRAIDRNPAYKFDVGSCSMTLTEANAWWLLDMQQEVDVEIVRLSNRISAHTRMSMFEIRIGMNQTDFSQNTLCYNMSETAPSGETMNYPCLSVTRGRYLSIQRYSTDPTTNMRGVQICEVQVIPPLSDTSHFNIAPYGKATQSSTSSFDGHASRAIDGFAIPVWLTGYTCTQTHFHLTNAWWMLDLGQTLTIALVRITNRDHPLNTLFNFEIRVGSNATEFTQNSLCFYMPGLVQNAVTEDFPCVAHIEGRYITIQRLYPYLTSNNKELTLCEVMVFQTGC